MHPEDRVLVAVMNRPQDLELARTRGWYRIPVDKNPRGVFYEYLAFYLTSAFGPQKWGIYHYARNLGHELVTRRELLPDQADHPRADQAYYKLLLGPIQDRVPPIASQRWRRITFLHTTWDRFQAAHEINDLFAEGDEFVDRLYHALRDAGYSPERCYPLREGGVEYVVDLAVPCQQGWVSIAGPGEAAESRATLSFSEESLSRDLAGFLQAIRVQVECQGGILLPKEAPSGPDREKIT